MAKVQTYLCTRKLTNQVIHETGFTTSQKIKMPPLVHPWLTITTTKCEPTVMTSERQVWISKLAKILLEFPERDIPISFLSCACSLHSLKFLEFFINYTLLHKNTSSLVGENVHANKVPMIIEEWPAIASLAHKNKATTNKVCIRQTKWQEWVISIPRGTYFSNSPNIVID